MVAKSFSGEVYPVPAPEVKQCLDQEPAPLDVPEKLSNGMSVHDFFQIQGEVNKKFPRQIRKSKKVVKPIITHKEFPEFISTIEEMNEDEFHSPK